MPRKIATNNVVGIDELLAFIRPRHRAIVLTDRSNGSAQASPVSCGVDPQGRIVIATYPDRAKVKNARRTGTAGVVVLSDDWSGPWVQVDGSAEILPAADALPEFVDYFRSISGEHPNWDEYRQAMIEQDKVLLRITPTSWGPVATGGFPARLTDQP